MPAKAISQIAIVPSAILLLLITSACSFTNVGSNVNSPTIIKSANDARQYRYLVLDNQLQVLLVADRDAEKAAAALDVYVGSRQDPDNRQGLAHFLEHMIFLGTKNYPEAGSYQQFISANGGSHNAYTSFEHTNYYFDIDNEALPQALDRFADFFVAPLFTAQYVEREVNAVESEYRARFKDEQRRVLDATQQIFNPRHPYNKFTVGSLGTLLNDSAEAVREDMMAFYQRYYSANRMSLVVVGDYSLEQLAALVEHRFTKVKNNAQPVEAITEPLFASAERESTAYSLPLFLAVEAEKPLRQLRFMFPMPDLQPIYQSKPLSFIGNILGHEGEGSLLSLLKRKGLVEALSTGTAVNYNGGSSFQISIALTDQGIEQLADIYRVVFDAIAHLQAAHQNEPQKTAALYREQQRLAAMDFRFFQQGSEKATATRAASNLHFYPPQSVLFGDYDFSDYRPDIVADYLARLNRSNVLVTLLASQLPQRFAARQVSPWFNAPYSVTPITANTFGVDTRPAAEKTAQSGGEKTAESGSEKTAQSGSEKTAQSKPKKTDSNKWVARYFHLPAPNPFIPRQFDLVSAKSNQVFADNAIPTLLETVPGRRLWFKTDDDFEIPKADAYFAFLTDYPRRSPRHAALSRLYSRVLNEQLNEFIYPAYLAGMDYAFYPQRRGFTLRLGGYSDSLETLAEKIIPALRDVQVSPQRFEGIKAELARSWTLGADSTPYRRLSVTLSRALYANSYSEEQLIAALNSLSVEDLHEYIDGLWPTVYIDSLVHGNADTALAQRLFARLSQLGSCDCRLDQRQHIGIVQVPKGRWQQQQSLTHGDAALLWYFQAGDDSLATTALSMLTAAMIKPRIFNQLRTEAQLGYVVGAEFFSLMHWPGLAFQVQSPATNETGIFAALQQFIESYIAASRDNAGTADWDLQVDFKQHQVALATRLRERDSNLRARSNRFWHALALGDLDFNRRERLADRVAAIDYKTWQQFVQHLLIGEEASLIQLTRPAAGPAGGIGEAQIWPDHSSRKQQQLPVIYYP